MSEEKRKREESKKGARKINSGKQNSLVSVRLSRARSLLLSELLEVSARGI